MFYELNGDDIVKKRFMNCTTKSSLTTFVFLDITDIHGT